MSAEGSEESDGGVGELLDTAPCGFLTFGEDGVVERVNATLLALLGRPREEVVGRHVGALLGVGSRIFYQTHWFPLLRLRGSAEEIFLRLVTREGGELGVLANARRREREGRAVYDCVLIEVRERQRFEEELLRARREAEHARTLAEARERETEIANARLEAQAVELDAQHRQLEEQAVELEAYAEEQRVLNDHLRVRTAEAEHLRHAAEEANRAKSAFLAVMSHELRTPLNAIAGYLQILQLEIHGPLTDAQRETLERVSRSQDHLLRLINDVLDLARIESGRVEYDLQPVEIAACAAAVAPMVEPQLRERGIGFESAVPHGLRARADVEKVQRILLNLLGNAAKFTAAGGEVRMEGSREEGGNRVLLRVTDTGIGIPEEQREAVFQPFVQVDASRTRSAQGSGLGLAISRDLARGMGGELTVASEPGKGSTFTLALPAEGDGEPAG